MQIRKTTQAAILESARRHQIMLDYDYISPSRGGGSTFRVKLYPSEENRMKYRRLSAPGPYKGQQLVNAICWCGFRDFLKTLFEITPDAVVVSAMARYEGAEDFENNHNATAFKNVGSPVMPVHFLDLCDHEEQHPPWPY